MKTDILRRDLPISNCPANRIIDIGGDMATQKMVSLSGKKAGARRPISLRKAADVVFTPPPAGEWRHRQLCRCGSYAADRQRLGRRRGLAPGDDPCLPWRRRSTGCRVWDLGRGVDGANVLPVDARPEAAI